MASNRRPEERVRTPRVPSRRPPGVARDTVVAAARVDPLPFEAVLGTILYSNDRRLAIVDGRIVQPGDDVRGARVIEIAPGEVLLRDAQGRVRRLTLASSSGR